MSDNIIFRTTEIPAEVPGRVARTPFFHSEDPRFKYRLEHGILIKILRDLPQFLQQNSVIMLQIRPILVPVTSFPNSFFMLIFSFVASWRNFLKASVKHEEQRSPWNRFLITKLITVFPREHKFPASYETRIFTNVARRTHDWYLSSTRWSNHTSSTHIITANFNIIIAPNPRSPESFFSMHVTFDVYLIFLELPNLLIYIEHYASLFVSLHPHVSLSARSRFSPFSNETKNK
jgi:hypothetical protein